MFLDNSVPKDEAIANAQLMSAAPELLQACIDMMGYCNKHNIEQLTPEYTNMVISVEKALNIKG